MLEMARSAQTYYPSEPPNPPNEEKSEDMILRDALAKQTYGLSLF